MNPADASPLTRAAHLGDATTLRPLDGGRNNRVFRVETASGTPALLKAYFHSEDDPRDRLAHEAGFTAFAVDRGLPQVPRLMGQDRDRRLALFSFVEGRMLEPDEVDAGRVEEAAGFFVDLNRHRDSDLAAALPLGSEACLSTIEHLALTDRRIRGLDAIGDPAAAAFIEGELKPRWAALHMPMAKREDAMAPAPRCVSPSDFGFHNAILDAATDRLVFHDFEYAGWDDPAKVLGDFYHQPRRPVPRATFDAFLAAASDVLGLDAGEQDRIRRLLPVYAFKWACIVLGPLLPAAAERRRFAGEPAADVDALLARARVLLTHSK